VTASARGDRETVVFRRQSSISLFRRQCGLRQSCDSCLSSSAWHTEPHRHT